MTYLQTVSFSDIFVSSSSNISKYTVVCQGGKGGSYDFDTLESAVSFAERIAWNY